MSTETKKEIVQTITSQKKFLKKVKINYPSRAKRFLAMLRIIPKYRAIYISDLWPATVFRLLGVLTDLKVSNTNEDVEIYQMIRTNIPLFIEFLAIGLHNKKSDPPEWLVDALNYQVSNEELLEYIIDIYRRLDVETFFGITGSLVSLQKLNPILEAEAHGR